QIEIETFRPFMASISRVGDRLYDGRWAFVWRVTVADASGETWFRAGVSRVGEPLRVWGPLMLQCAFAALAPAHTKIIWATTGAVWDAGASIWDDGESHWDQT